MKSFVFCSAVLVAGLLASVSHAAPPVRVSVVQEAYCHAYAESEYAAAIARGDALPDAAFEGADEECEFQWAIQAVQWDEPNYQDQEAELGLRSLPLPFDAALRVADTAGRYGVDRLGTGWVVTSADEDRAADEGR